MPQLAPVVLNNRFDPPGTHTFTPRGVDGGVATLVESSGIPLGDRRVTVSQVRTGNGRIKVTIKIAMPVVQDVVESGVSRPLLVRTAYAECVFSFDPSSSTAERGMISEFMSGLCNNQHPLMVGVIEDLEGLY